MRILGFVPFNGLCYAEAEFDFAARMIIAATADIVRSDYNLKGK